MWWRVLNDCIDEVLIICLEMRHSQKCETKYFHLLSWKEFPEQLLASKFEASSFRTNSYKCNIKLPQSCVITSKAIMWVAYSSDVEHIRTNNRMNFHPIYFMCNPLL